jgi:hypothetical protein
MHPSIIDGKSTTGNRTGDHLEGTSKSGFVESKVRLRKGDVKPHLRVRLRELAKPDFITGKSPSWTTSFVAA